MTFGTFEINVPKLEVGLRLFGRSSIFYTYTHDVIYSSSLR